jgi:hypothetical protein
MFVNPVAGISSIIIDPAIRILRWLLDFGGV